MPTMISIKICNWRFFICLTMLIPLTQKSMENKGIAEENADTRRALLKCLEAMESELDDFMAVYPALTETTNENTNDKGE